MANMITNTILGLIYYFVLIITAPVRLFPDVTADSNFGSAIVTASSYLGALDKFLPIDTLFIVIGIILGIEIILAGYKIIMWIIRRIPTQS